MSLLFRDSESKAVKNIWVITFLRGSISLFQTIDCLDWLFKDQNWLCCNLYLRFEINILNFKNFLFWWTAVKKKAHLIRATLWISLLSTKQEVHMTAPALEDELQCSNVKLTCQDLKERPFKNILAKIILTRLLKKSKIGIWMLGLLLIISS